MGFASCTYTVTWEFFPGSCCPFSLGSGMNALGADLSPILREKPSPAYVSCTPASLQRCESKMYIAVCLCGFVIVCYTAKADRYTLKPPFDPSMFVLTLSSLDLTPDSWSQLQSLCWPLHPAFGKSSPNQAPAVRVSGKIITLLLLCHN